MPARRSLIGGRRKQQDNDRSSASASQQAQLFQSAARVAASDFLRLPSVEAALQSGSLTQDALKAAWATAANLPEGAQALASRLDFEAFKKLVAELAKEGCLLEGVSAAPAPAPQPRRSRLMSSGGRGSTAVLSGSVRGLLSRFEKDRSSQNGAAAAAGNGDTGGRKSARGSWLTGRGGAKAKAKAGAEAEERKPSRKGSWMKATLKKFGQQQQQQQQQPNDEEHGTEQQEKTEANGSGTSIADAFADAANGAETEATAAKEKGAGYEDEDDEQKLSSHEGEIQRLRGELASVREFLSSESAGEDGDDANNNINNSSGSATSSDKKKENGGGGGEKEQQGAGQNQTTNTHTELVDSILAMTGRSTITCSYGCDCGEEEEERVMALSLFWLSFLAFWAFLVFLV
eukprot:g1883.t1